MDTDNSVSRRKSVNDSVSRRNSVNDSVSKWSEFLTVLLRGTLMDRPWVHLGAGVGIDPSDTGKFHYTICIRVIQVTRMTHCSWVVSW